MNARERNVSLLTGLRDLLAGLDPERYARAAPDLELSGAGTHVRHALEFYVCFLDGIDAGRVDYDARRREEALETDRDAAVVRIDAILGEWPTVPPESGAISVHQDDPGAEWCDSTVGRELQFLAAHLVHHLALVAVILRHHGEEVPAGFGIAPSTLEYWKSRGARAG